VSYLPEHTTWLKMENFALLTVMIGFEDKGQNILF
jgi:hypothetical protein